MVSQRGTYFKLIVPVSCDKKKSQPGSSVTILLHCVSNKTTYLIDKWQFLAVLFPLLVIIISVGVCGAENAYGGRKNAKTVSFSKWNYIFYVLGNLVSLLIMSWPFVNERIPLYCKQLVRVKEQNWESQGYTWGKLGNLAIAWSLPNFIT